MSISKLIERSPARWSYATWVDLGHRFFYVETPKVACTKIKSCLQVIAGYETPKNLESIHYRSDPENFVGNILSIPDFEKRVLDETMFRFCFVRNPAERAISAYKDKIVASPGPFWEKYRQDIRAFHGLGPDEEITFLSFLEHVASLPDAQRDIHWRSQKNLLQPAVFRYNFIGKIERFDSDFSYVLGRLSVDDPHRFVSGRENASRPAASPVQLDQYTLDLIHRIYQDDYALFGYENFA